MGFKWAGSFIVDHSNHYNYVPIAFFYIPQVRTRVSLEKVLSDRSYRFSSITFEKTRIPNNLEMWKYTAPAPRAGETSQHFSMVYIWGVHAEIAVLMTWHHPTAGTPGKCFWLVEANFQRGMINQRNTHSWVVRHHQQRISSLVPQTGKPVVV